MGPLGVYKSDDAREIHRLVLGQSSAQPWFDAARQQTIHNLLYYGLLESDLDAASDSLTGYTQANIRVIRYIQPMLPNTLNMEESTSTEGLQKVTNRFTDFSAKAGDLLLIIRNGSEWSPINVASSSSQKHARIASCLGNGYYTANLSTSPTFSIPSSETGTGTIAGVGTGSGLTNECDMCSLVYGGNVPVGTGIDYGEANCGVTVQPSRVQVPGDGTLIYVYDPRKLTLAVGAHVIVADLGDRVADPAPAVGTGTGTATSNVILWMVLTGTYDIIGIPDRFYTCCELDGVRTVKMIRCDTYITEGFYCPGNQVECPVGTGSV